MANKKINTINIKGKEYAQVHDRVNHFRQENLYKGFSINTEVLFWKENEIIIKASIYNSKSNDNLILASGIAHEEKSNRGVNATSYVENCETSAIGRALACLGIGTEDAYASSFEVENAIDQQKNQVNKNASLQEKMEAKIKVNMDDIIDEINASIFAGIAEEHMKNVPSFLAILSNPDRTVAQTNELHTFARMYPDNEHYAQNFAVANKGKWQLSKPDEEIVRSHLGFIKTLFDTIPFESERVNDQENIARLKEAEQFEQEMNA